ncbi:MAG: iron-sulfur cluster assembly scaffold protein [archaeon GB-1867-005]|nr:iron-sulfur cluster assembly scaffold protein [Candidatus Culexmicrobium cathedralense]
MSSRIPLPYGPKVLELFRNPKNLGRLDDANAVAVAGSLACGDMIAIYLKIDEETQVIEKATFESYGCAANIAVASIMTEMIKGKTLKEAWNVSWMQLSEALGGLPAIKYHCGVLAVGALRRAIREYFKGKRKPDWLPDELTSEERHALEEEKLVEMLSKRMKRSS